MVVEPGGDGAEVAAGKEALDAVEEGAVDRERVGERPVRRTRLLDDDRSVALEDVRPDFAVMPGDELLNRLRAAQDALPRFLDARRTERVGGSRPSERRFRSLGALEERSWCPGGLECLRWDSTIDCLEERPCDARGTRERMLNRSPHIHPLCSHVRIDRGSLPATPGL